MVAGDNRHTYIHIPFCRQICSYCDFCKVFYNEKLVSKYLISLDQEINDIYNNEYQETIYIGGGTPSALKKNELQKLFNILKKINYDNNTEVTFECNFDSITEEKLDLLKENGVNRLSFGLETTNRKVLKNINRKLDLAKVLRIINYCKKIGINNINIDLMYGFNDLYIPDLQKDIDFILKLDVPHISTYSLEIHEHTKFYIDKICSINESIDREMYEFIHKKLTLKNYNHYEISNFSKKGYESKHNLCYWKNETYYGFGVGASSYLKSKRITNYRSITSYINHNQRKDEEKLDTKDKIIYEMILGLRLKEGINIEDFYRKYNMSIYDLFDLNDLITKKLIIIEDNNMKVPFERWYTINSILINFLEIRTLN